MSAVRALNIFLALFLAVSAAVALRHGEHSVALLCLGISYLVRIHEQLREILGRLKP